MAASAAAVASQNRVMANSKVRIAVLGVNGRGQDHIAGFGGVPEAEVVCLCDPDMRVAGKTALRWRRHFAAPTPIAYFSDLR